MTKGEKNVDPKKQQSKNKRWHLFGIKAQTTRTNHKKRNAETEFPQNDLSLRLCFVTGF